MVTLTYDFRDSSFYQLSVYRIQVFNLSPWITLSSYVYIHIPQRIKNEMLCAFL
jgi:hypothetical protein